MFGNDGAGDIVMVFLEKGISFIGRYLEQYLTGICGSGDDIRPPQCEISSVSNQKMWQ